MTQKLPKICTVILRESYGICSIYLRKLMDHPVYIWAGVSVSVSVQDNFMICWRNLALMVYIEQQDIFLKQVLCFNPSVCLSLSFSPLSLYISFLSLFLCIYLSPTLSICLSGRITAITAWCLPLLALILFHILSLAWKLQGLIISLLYLAT